MTVFGFLAGSGLILSIAFALKYRAKFNGLDLNQFVQVTIVVLLSAYFGSHLGWMLSPDGAAQRSSLYNWFAVNQGGKSGAGLMGALVAVMLMGYLQKGSIWFYVATMAQAGFIALGFVRIGCALNHEHLGSNAPFWLGFQDQDGNFKHDLGLYECVFLWTLVIPAVWRFRNSSARAERFIFKWISLFLLFRFALEFFRINEISVMTIYLPAIYLALALFFYFIKNRALDKLDQNPN